MIKKKYIKRLYKASILCDNCQVEMKKTGIAYCTSPLDYEYICPKCKLKKYSHIDIDQLQYEYEELE